MNTDSDNACEINFANAGIPKLQNVTYDAGTDAINDGVNFGCVYEAAADTSNAEKTKEDEEGFQLLMNFFDLKLKKTLAVLNRSKSNLAELENKKQELTLAKFRLLFTMTEPFFGDKLNALAADISENTSQNLKQLQNLIAMDDKLSADYSAHCQQAILSAQETGVEAKYDEYTMMPTVELQKVKDEVETEIEQVSAKLVEYTATLKSKENNYAAQCQDILAEINELRNYEKESAESLEKFMLEMEDITFLQKR